MPKRVSLKTVALAAGVSIGTTSMALRGVGRTAPATVRRVHAVAKRLGYTPDPTLSRLMSYLHADARLGRQETIAYVTAYPQRETWRTSSSTLRRFHEGAEQRAAELGYRFEDYWLAEPGISQRRHSQILHSRGVQGLLLAPHPDAHATLSLDWPKFTPVTIGLSIEQPALHRVLGNHYTIVRLALRHMRALGYHRIGFAMELARIERVNRLWQAAYMADVEEQGESARLPMFVQPEPFLGEEFVAWFKAYRPDAIIGPGPHLLEFLAEKGWQAPRDFGYAALDLDLEDRDHAGVIHQSKLVGRIAVEQLVAALHRNELGVPQHPHLTLVEGVWRDGGSLSHRGAGTGGGRAKAGGNRRTSAAC